METIDNNLKLYSRNKARKLLGIGLTVLDMYINTGLIGTIPTTRNKVKIPHQELQRFIDENIKRERKIALHSSNGRLDVSDFFNDHRANDDKELNSVTLFKKIMEKN
ncbi:MAG: hypothetical protein HYV28_13245 [Ignavibacteriales bacterium]|nr:hypothetical protein [Ignavibacteriales bacterium]